MQTFCECSRPVLPGKKWCSRCERIQSASAARVKTTANDGRRQRLRRGMDEFRVGLSGFSGGKTTAYRGMG